MPISTRKFVRGKVDILSLFGVGFLTLSLVAIVTVTSNPLKTQLIGTYAKGKEKVKETGSAFQNYVDSKIRQRERTGACVGKYCVAEDVIKNRESQGNQSNAAPSAQTAAEQEIIDTYDKALKGDTAALDTLKKNNSDLAAKVEQALQAAPPAPQAPPQSTNPSPTQEQIAILLKYAGLNSDANFTAAQDVCNKLGGTDCGNPVILQKFISDILSAPENKTLVSNQVNQNLSAGGVSPAEIKELRATAPQTQTQVQPAAPSTDESARAAARSTTTTPTQTAPTQTAITPTQTVTQPQTTTTSQPNTPQTQQVIATGIEILRTEAVYLGIDVNSISQAVKNTVTNYQTLQTQNPNASSLSLALKPSSLINDIELSRQLTSTFVSLAMPGSGKIINDLPVVGVNRIAKASQQALIGVQTPSLAGPAAITSISTLTGLNDVVNSSNRLFYQMGMTPEEAQLYRSNVWARFPDALNVGLTAVTAGDFAASSAIQGVVPTITQGTLGMQGLTQAGSNIVSQVKKVTSAEPIINAEVRVLAPGEVSNAPVIYVGEQPQTITNPAQLLTAGPRVPNPAGTRIATPAELDLIAQAEATAKSPTNVTSIILSNEKTSAAENLAFSQTKSTTQSLTTTETMLVKQQAAAATTLDNLTTTDLNLANSQQGKLSLPNANTNLQTAITESDTLAQELATRPTTQVDIVSENSNPIAQAWQKIKTFFASPTSEQGGVIKISTPENLATKPNTTQISQPESLQSLGSLNPEQKVSTLEIRGAKGIDAIAPDASYPMTETSKSVTTIKSTNVSAINSEALNSTGGEGLSVDQIRSLMKSGQWDPTAYQYAQSPIIAYRLPDGSIYVQSGRHRVEAYILEGVDEIPNVIIHEPIAAPIVPATTEIAAKPTNPITQAWDNFWNKPQVPGNESTVRSKLFTDAGDYIKENGLWKWLTGPTPEEAPGLTTAVSRPPTTPSEGIIDRIKTWYTNTSEDIAVRLKIITPAQKAANEEIAQQIAAREQQQIENRLSQIGGNVAQPEAPIPVSVGQQNAQNQTLAQELFGKATQFVSQNRNSVLFTSLGIITTGAGGYTISQNFDAIKNSIIGFISNLPKNANLTSLNLSNKAGNSEANPSKSQQSQQTEQKSKEPALNRLNASNRASATSFDEVKLVAASLRNGTYAYDYGNSLCGPLSLQILKDNGIISTNVDINTLYDFDPTKEMYLLDKVFPAYNFTRINTFGSHQNLSSYDWKDNPLKAGDWISTWGGTFGHMFVISEVTKDGKVYAYMNYVDKSLTAGSQVDWNPIGKVLVWDQNDPNNPDAMFNKWSNAALTKQYGSTGLNGFILIRPTQATLNAALTGQPLPKPIPLTKEKANVPTPPGLTSKGTTGECRVVGGSYCDGNRMFELYKWYKNQPDAWWNQEGELTPSKFLAVMLVGEATSPNPDPRLLKAISEATTHQLWGSAPDHKPYCTTEDCAAGIFNFLGAYVQSAGNRYNGLISNSGNPSEGTLANLAAGEDIYNVFKANGLSLDQIANDIVNNPNPQDKTYSNDVPTQWGSPQGGDPDTKWIINFYNSKNSPIDTTNSCGLYYVGGGDVVYTMNQRNTWSTLSGTCH